MKHPQLKAAIKKLNAKRKALRDVLDEARTDSGEFDPAKVENLDLPDGVAFRDWVHARNDELDELHEDVEERKVAARVLDEAFADPMNLEPTDGDGTAQAGRVMSFGDAFVKSAAYKNRGGSIGPMSTLDLDVKNTLFQRSAGAAPESIRTGYIDLSPERRPAVLNFVPAFPTSQSSVKFMRETTYTATNVVEKAEGAAFGEAALALTEVSLPVEKIPAFIPVTDEQLEDVEWVRAYLDGRLEFMVRARLDLQILQGDASTPNLEGTENVTGIQVQALAGDDITDGAYKLFTKIRDDNDNSGGDAEPSVAFIRAAKWQTVQLMRTTDGIYIWGSPSQAGPMTIWGVPRVLTNAVTSTKLVAGDYTAHSYVAVKRDIDVQISNSHDDYFVKGKQAIRADVRVAMIHLRPSAFGELTGL